MSIEMSSHSQYHSYTPCERFQELLQSSTAVDASLILFDSCCRTVLSHPTEIGLVPERRPEIRRPAKAVLPAPPRHRVLSSMVMMEARPKDSSRARSAFVTPLCVFLTRAIAPSRHFEVLADASKATIANRASRTASLNESESMLFKH